MKPLSKDLTYFLSGSVFLGFSSAYSLLVPVVIIPYIIKTVGLNNYGLSVIAFSATFFLSLIIDYGYTISGVNSLSKSKSDDEKGKIISKALYTKLILFLGLLLLSGLLVVLVPYLWEHRVLFSLSMAIPLSSIFNLNWGLQGLQMIKPLCGVSILNKTIYLIGILLFVKSTGDYIYINFVFGLGAIAAGLLSLYLIKRRIPLSAIKFTFSDFISEINESIHYFVSNISIYVSTSLYPIILGFFVSAEIVGVFAAIEKIYNVMRAPFSIYINLMLPRISFKVEKSLKEAIVSIKNTYIFVVGFILIITLIVINFQIEIVRYFVKDYFDLSIHLLQTACAGIILVLFNCPIYLLLVAMDQRKAIMKTFLFVPVVGIITCLALSKFYGAKGAFYTIVFVEFSYVVSLNVLFYVRKNIFRKGA
ncbi:oligosaccharide flippase family protein [Aquimarina sp. SS2-1]|uniref:oligosaccharide flippase family protein n=1 Tax=Aquimarina besae TaxID=3342247 RepID=UPI003670C913